MSSSLCVDHGVVPSERPQELGCKVAAAADVVLAAAVVGHPDVHVEGGLAVLRREGAHGAPQFVPHSEAVFRLLVPGLTNQENNSLNSNCYCF